MKRYHNEDCWYSLHPAPVYICTDSVSNNCHKSFVSWKSTALGKREGCVIKVTAASLRGGQKDQWGNTGRKKERTTLLGEVGHTTCRQELPLSWLHSLCKMLSKSLKPVFPQVTPNRAVPTLYKAKPPRANLPECRDLTVEVTRSCASSRWTAASCQVFWGECKIKSSPSTSLRRPKLKVFQSFELYMLFASIPQLQKGRQYLYLRCCKNKNFPVCKAPGKELAALLSSRFGWGVK